MYRLEPSKRKKSFDCERTGAGSQAISQKFEQIDIDLVLMERVVEKRDIEEQNIDIDWEI